MYIYIYTISILRFLQKSHSKTLQYAHPNPNSAPVKKTNLSIVRVELFSNLHIFEVGGILSVLFSTGGRRGKGIEEEEKRERRKTEGERQQKIISGHENDNKKN